MEFSRVARAREMNRAPGLYQMGDRGELCANSLCVVSFSAMLCIYVRWKEHHLYVMWEWVNPLERAEWEGAEEKQGTKLPVMLNCSCPWLRQYPHNMSTSFKEDFFFLIRAGGIFFYLPMKIKQMNQFLLSLIFHVRSPWYNYLPWNKPPQPWSTES